MPPHDRGGWQRSIWRCTQVKHLRHLSGALILLVDYQSSIGHSSTTRNSPWDWESIDRSGIPLTMIRAGSCSTFGWVPLFSLWIPWFSSGHSWLLMAWSGYTNHKWLLQTNVDNTPIHTASSTTWVEPVPKTTRDQDRTHELSQIWRSRNQDLWKVEGTWRNLTGPNSLLIMSLWGLPESVLIDIWDKNDHELYAFFTRHSSCRKNLHGLQIFWYHIELLKFSKQHIHSPRILQSGVGLHDFASV